MHKTPFSKKCEILGSLWLFYSKEELPDEGWDSYFQAYDVGLPLAYFVWTDIATVNDGKNSYIEDAWNDLCKMMNLPTDGDYENLTNFLAESHNGKEDKNE